MSEHVKAEVDNGILVLTLHPPDKKNALTGAMYDALSDAPGRAEADSTVRVVLF
jgi:enoyl-CoA hydratase/carnithine racemase